MKKAFSFLLILILLSFSAGQAETVSGQPDGDGPGYAEETPEESGISAAAGDWYADSGGAAALLRLNADGTYEFRLAGDVSRGVWEQEDDRIILDGAAEYALEMLGGEALILADADMFFTREEPETYVPAEPVPDAEPGWFTGYWESVYAERNGVPVPARTAGDHTDIYIDGGLVALGGRLFGDVFREFAFENGSLSAVLDDGRTVTISFQQDSLLRMAITGPEEETVLWLAPAWSEALDREAEEDE